MSFEETDIEDSASSLSEVSSLDDDFDTMLIISIMLWNKGLK